MKLPLWEVCSQNHVAEEFLVSYMYEITTGQSPINNRDPLGSQRPLTGTFKQIVIIIKICYLPDQDPTSP